MNTVSRTCVRIYERWSRDVGVRYRCLSARLEIVSSKHERVCMYIYIHRVRIMQASPLSTFRLRIWVGHELIVYNESALNRRVDAMRQRATLGVYRDFCNWNVFRTLMHESHREVTFVSLIKSTLTGSPIDCVLCAWIDRLFPRFF